MGSGAREGEASAPLATLPRFVFLKEIDRQKGGATEQQGERSTTSQAQQVFLTGQHITDVNRVIQLSVKELERVL